MPDLKSTGGGPDARCTDPLPLGVLIQRQRRERGLTQEELAEGICTRPYISQIEQGNRFPAPIIMKQLAEKLGRPLEHFAASYAASPMAGINQCLGLAKIQAKQGNSEEARRTYEAARELHHRRGNPPADVPALKETMGMILMYEGRFEQSEPILLKAFAQRSEAGGLSEPLVEICAVLGVAYSRRGDLKRGAEMFQKAFNIVFAIGTSSNPARSAWLKEM